MLRSPKQKFIATAYFLVQYVMSFDRPKKRNPLLEKTDAYGAWMLGKPLLIQETRPHCG